MQGSPLGKLRTEVGCGLRAREACPQFPPREPQCRIRWQLITILQTTFAIKPYSMVLQGTSASEVEGKGAHLQRRTPSQGLQTAIAIKGELQNRLHLAAAIVPRRRKSLLGVNSVPHPALAVSCSMEQHPCTRRPTGTCGGPSAKCAGSDGYSDTACNGKGGRPRSASP